MKKIIVTALLVTVLSAPSVMSQGAIGSSFGTLTTGQSIGMGQGSLLGGFGFADIGTSVFGVFNYGLSDYFDGRLKIGINDFDFGETEVVFGADAKYQIWDYNPSAEATASQNPFDMSIGGFFEYLGAEGFTVWQIGGKVIGSYPVMLNNGHQLVPYGAINIRLENYDVDLGPFGDWGDSELEFGLHAGAKYDFTKDINGYLEVQLDGNEGLFAGVEFMVI